MKTLENKFYKCMTLVSKIVYIDKLPDIVNTANHMKHADVMLSI